MKKVPLAIFLGTLFAVFYNLTPFIGVADKVILILFSLSPFVVIWMAYRILKFGDPPTYTWEDKFYEDYD